MHTLSTSVLLFTQSLCWALINSLWQGLFILIALELVLKLSPNSPPKTRYTLSLSAFAAIFLWFGDTWRTEYQKLEGTVVYITNGGINDAQTGIQQVRVIPVQHDTNTFFHFTAPKIEQHFTTLMLLYYIGLTFMMVRFALNYVQVNSLKKNNVRGAGAEWNNAVRNWCDQLNISRQVKVLLSARINVPMMLGTIKPIILLPIATINHLTTEQVEAILLHELAHIKRHDYLINMIQTAGETILFFNPSVWLISSVIRKEREHCCDDLVVSYTGAPLPYAKALALLEGERNNNPKLALAATGRKHQLFHRIKRIMEMKKRNLSHSQFAVILLAIVALTFAAILFTFTPSMAQKAKTGKSDTIKKKSYYHYKTVTIDDKGKRIEEERTSDKPIKEIDKKKGRDVTVSFYDDEDEDSMRPHFRHYSQYEFDSSGFGDMMKNIMIVTSDAMKEASIAMAKAHREMSNIDWDAIGDEVDRSFDEVDRELNDPKLRKEISKDVKKSLKEARRSLEAAKESIKEQKRIAEESRMRHGSRAYSYNYSDGSKTGTDDYETMLKKMERDGLINSSEGYAIKKANDELYINGVKQPDEVYEKYKPYLQGKTVAVEGSEGKLKISVKE